MLTVTIPGKGTLSLKHMVLDFNGTMACDGTLIPGVEGVEHRGTVLVCVPQIPLTSVSGSINNFQIL